MPAIDRTAHRERDCVTAMPKSEAVPLHIASARSSIAVDTCSVAVVGGFRSGAPTVNTSGGTALCANAWPAAAAEHTTTNPADRRHNDIGLCRIHDHFQWCCGEEKHHTDSRRRIAGVMLRSWCDCVLTLDQTAGKFSLRPL